MSGVDVVARSWSWRYATRQTASPRGISLQVASGEAILLAGPSGSGKSTFLAALAGVLGDDQGAHSGLLSVGNDPPLAGLGIAGLVLQDPESQTIRETVGDDVAFGCESLGVPRAEIWFRVEHALEAVGLNLPPDHPTHRLSGGEKQRLAIAGVLAMGPRLLLLDEPTANLDPDGARAVVRAVAAVKKETGCTLVVVDHNTHFWSDVLDRVVTLNRDGTMASESAILPMSSRLPPHPVPSVNGGNLVMSTSRLVVGRPGGPRLSVNDMSWRSGKVSALIGPNGSGKTTLALTLGGLLPPLGGGVLPGDALVNGLSQRVTNKPWKWPARCLARRIGNVFQSPEAQFVRASVRDELLLGLRLAGLRGRDAISAMSAVLERLRLAHIPDAHPATLSGGEQRRLSLAAVLASRPTFVVADEPTFGQDDATWLEVVTMLREAADGGAAVVVATHDTELTATADHCEVLGPVAALSTREAS